LQGHSRPWWIFEATFDIPFLAWLEGKHAARTVNNWYFAARRVGSQAAYLECLPRGAEVEISPRWQVRLRAEAPLASLYMDGLSLQSSDVQLTLGAHRRSSALDLVNSPAATAAATFDLLDPRIVAGTACAGQVGSEILALTFDALRSAQATIALQQDGIQQTILSLVGEAGVDVSTRAGDVPSVLSGLRLAPAGLVASVLRKSEQRLLVATVARAANEIDTPNVVLSVAGTESSRIAAVFENGLSAPIEVEIEIYSAAVPVAGADTGRIQFAPMPFDLVIGRAMPKPDVLDANVWLSGYRARSNSPAYVQAAAEGPEAACVEKGKTRGLLVAGPTPFFMAPLEQNTWLQVLRSQDLLSLKFGFRNFSVEVRNGRAELVPRSLPAKLFDGAKFDHRLLVEFPPQHVAEQAIRTQLGIGSTPAGNLNFHDRTVPPTSGIQDTPEDSFPPVVKARLSGPTRLVFREKDPVRKALSVRTLTDWKGLAQVVSERAMRTDTPLDKQLQVVGIYKSTSRAEALVKIIQSIRPPRDDETAIEFPYRLILSPDDRAQWITPQRPLGALNTPTLLWNARLNRSKGGQSVRAVWARDILLDFLRGNLPVENVAKRDEYNEPPFIQSLSRSDRRELVTLSSVYGLPALRRVVLDKDKALNNAANPSAPASRKSDDPAGGVQPFPDKIGLWKYDGTARVPVPDEGIYVPKPLALADLSLTAMGATFVGEGQWEPPSPIVLPYNDNLPDIDHNWRPSLRLERWNHRSVLGRDIYVEVAYKGFLFPIGHRASLLKVSERRFFPHPETKKPTAYLIQRLFIVVGKREKNFPALGQPFDGRPWPAHLITMAAGRTPDLRDPEHGADQQANGRLLFGDGTGAPLNGLVFWPRVAAYDSSKLGSGPKLEDRNIIVADQKEVAFQFRKDEDTQPISAPLLFIDNVAAHEPPTMQAVLKYYRETLPEGSTLRLATHGSVRRRYAPPVKDGETELDTQSWDLSATGRYIAADATKGVAESFAVDGMMEGADQPPFYPVVRTANIKVQSVDRMIGTPAGSMTAAFNESYVRHGFAPDQNPSELFLDVLSPAIYLNFAGAGDAVGGLAKPNARLVALSRKFGPVGGKAPPPPSQTSGAFKLLAANPPTAPAPIGGLGGLPPRGDYSSFASGVLDPKEFLGGADSLPKLLGIFSLADVLKAVAFTNSGPEAENKVPKLQETTGFSGIGADLAGQLANVKAVFVKIADDFIGPSGTGGIIGDTLKQIETTIRTRLGDGQFDWRKLYPRLSAAFENLRNALSVARTQAKGTNDPAQLGRLIPYGSAVVTAGKALIAEVGAVRDNPMPPLVGDILAELTAEWDNLRRFAQLDIGNGVTDLHFIIDGVKKNVAEYLAQFYTDLLLVADAQTAVEIQALIDLILSVVPSAPFTFSTAVDEKNPGDGNLALNNTVQKNATLIRVNLTDADGNQITSLIDALDGSPLNGLGYLRTSDAADDSKWLLFRLKGLLSQKNYRNFQVELKAASGDAPLTKDIVLAYIPYLDFNALDPAAIAKRVANTLLYEVAGEQIVSAYAAVRDLAAALSGVIDTNARDIGAKLTTVTAKLFDAALAMAQAAEKSGVMSSVANWCDKAMEFVIDVSDKVINTGHDLSGFVVGISNKAGAIKLPPGAPADIRAKVDQARAALIQAQERLSRCLMALEVHRKQIIGFASQCHRIHQALSLSGKIMVLRRDALAALQDIILQARMIAAAIDEIPPAQFQNFATAADDLQGAKDAVYELVKNVTELLQSLTSIKTASSGAGGAVILRIQANVKTLTDSLTGSFDHYKKEIEGARDELTAAAGTLQARISRIALDVERWKDSNGTKPFPPDLAAVGSDVLSYAVKHDRRFAALVLQSTQTFNTAKKQLQDTAVKILGIITTPLLEAHKVAIAAAEKILPLIDKDSAAPENKDRAEFLSFILAPGVVAAFKDLSRIKQDRDSLVAIKQAANAQAAFAAAFQIKERWTGQDPALVRKIDEVSRIVDSLSHGQLSEVINLDGVRALVEEQIKEALLSFIPTKVDLAYDWKTNLQPFADIFEMRNTADDDLTLAVRTSIDLLHPESRTTRVTGTLKGFRVHILGKASGSGESSVGSFLSIYFSGAEFSSVNGSRPDFKADMEDVKIGPALEFIRQLGQYLSYSGGGFYVRLTLSPLGIEAGFEFSEDIISLGAITFFNVGFSISAQLPFQDRDARFRFALASADAPFMVSVLPCYGGGGFFAITSNGREIVQAECSAEFGAIVGLKFGPLSASGRVMAGIYIRQAQGGGAFIKGFVHAVGEGHIACFSVTVNIEVCIVHLPNGTMYGQSSYRFTFKVGFAEVGYGVTATYSIASKGGGGGGGNAELVAFVQPKIVTQIMKEHPSCHLHEKKFITTRVPSKSRHWTRYRERIDLSLLEA
jgi:hypothetical protein